jgi:hypothetical protein
MPYCPRCRPADVGNPENALRTHHVAYPISGASGSVFRVLILTRSSVDPSAHGETLSAVQRFSALTGGVDTAIFYLATSSATVSDAHRIFTKLQLLLLTNDISVPLLYVASAEDLVGALKTCSDTTADGGAWSVDTARPNAPVDILPHCTIEAPMDQSDLTAVSDMCSSLRDFAAIATEENGVSVMVSRGLTEAAAESCAEFWNREWLAE